MVGGGEERAGDREVLLGHALLDEIADHDEHDEVERLHAGQFSPPDHAHEHPDEDEDDGGADDDVHYGKTAISWSRARIGAPPSSSTTPWSRVPIVVGLTWY